MTRHVQREEIIDYATYAEGRENFRAKILAMKATRRAHVGVLTFLFENHETVRYQVQEMMLAEKIVKDADIRHELESYNELLGGPGEIGATLLIEIESAAERDEKLARWLDLPRTLYMKLEDGRRVRPIFDERQIGEGRLSSVQYLKFPTGGAVPVAIGCEHPDIATETALSSEQRAALAADLAEG